jgi:acetyl-CoA C-acetyltransferase
MNDDRTPVIVGVGQITDTSTPPDRARSPLQLMVAAVRIASDDAVGDRRDELLRAADSIIVVRMFADAVARFKSPHGHVANPPWSIANRISAAPRELVYTPGGGTMPQVALNHACERIALGESSVAILTGAEALRTELGARRAGVTLNWNEDAPSSPEEWGGYRTPYSEHEAAHNMQAAINTYPLFEQAIRGARGRSIEAHQKAMGRLFAKFAAVARDNPMATKRQGYSAEEIATVTPENPITGFPYTKLMTASVYVDQSAAVIVCSAAKADEFGIPAERRVYLHGCAHADDHWFVTERINLHSSPAIRNVVKKTFDMAGKTLADVSAFDLYSCFPSAVEIACQEIGLDEESDPRDFTVTGGLPYFGGPGNNYVMHSIAEMVQRVRKQPGAFGLVTANGNYVTRHAAGLYSTQPIEHEWVREDPSILQRELDAMPKAPFTETPNGTGTIESYTVVHSKNGPELGIVVGRLADDTRFIANTPKDPALFADLECRDALGRRGSVRQENGKNLFMPI